MESSLPLPTELRSLVAQLAALQLAIEQNRDLLSRLASLLDARAVGHERMDLPVDLGLGYSVDGVVEDTSKIILSMGVDDLWAELELEKAQSFTEERIRILEKRAAGLEEPIRRQKEEYALITKTLRDALQLPDLTETTS